jgi:hypothetical protein
MGTDMPQIVRPRSISQVVCNSPGCLPLKAAYDQAVTLKPKSWTDIQDLFLTAMARFDQNVASGVANMGDLQNGKGDFLNDLLALILENCAGVQLYSRGRVPGLIIPRHNLDVTFPRTGAIDFVLEAKAVGTPKHPGSQKQKAIGRPGSADLDKRIKEIGFKTIDLKAEYARLQTQRGVSPTSMSGDLTAWLRSVKPISYVFLAARVVSEKDHARVIAMSHQAALVSDAVGVFCFRPVEDASGAKYESLPVPAPLEMSRVLFRACQELTAIKNARPGDL